jgi:hypothetical protein
MPLIEVKGGSTQGISPEIHAKIALYPVLPGLSFGLSRPAVTQP